MSGRFLITALSIAAAFLVGRLSVGWIGARPTSAPRALVADTPIPEDKQTGRPLVYEGTAGGVAAETRKVESKPEVNLPGASGAGTKLSSAAAQQCLAQVSRHDLYEWTSALEMKLDSFLETDPRFASKSKMSAGDWKRVSDFGDIVGTVNFNLARAGVSKLRILFKAEKLELAILYRRAEATDVKEYVTSRSSWTLRNGSGLGPAQDGGGYHAVMQNPVQEPEWAAYSHFAVSIPFDWDRRAEVTSEVFGLTEELKWETVGTAKLQHAKSAAIK